MPMTHDELQAAIWNDERGLPPGTREVALAMAWVLHKEPEHRNQPWKRVTQMLGHCGSRWRIHECVAEAAEAVGRVVTGIYRPCLPVLLMPASSASTARSACGGGEGT